MTLPTGVSTFLLECLDVDSTAYSNTGVSNILDSWPSPETFRDDASERSNIYSVMYKNSTLLDSSKAMTIDKIPQISNISSILEPVLEDFQDQHTRRKRPSDCNYSSSSLNVSTILAGKKVCKITTARERTPGLKTSMRCSSPLGPEGKPNKPTAKPKKWKPKEEEKSSHALEEGTSSSSQLLAPENTLPRSVGLAAGALPTKQVDTDPLCGRREICSIVRISPCQRPSQLHRVPVNTEPLSLPKRVPEDTITSTKNWIFCKPR
ncbi:MEIKN protein, partial [Heliornis fulica]|nr:MEIKN protein [Heliornis fulica]